MKTDPITAADMKAFVEQRNDAELRASIRERFPKRDDRTYDPYGQPTHKTLVLTIDQYAIVMQAWRKMQAQEGDTVTKGQCVELCCADYLGGPD